MIDFTTELERLKQRRLQRRTMMKSAAIGGAAALAGSAAAAGRANAQTVTPDIEVFQFALNLEYLEAEYYLRGVTGTGLTAAQTAGAQSPGSETILPPVSTTVVPFQTEALAYYFIDIASEENAHVNFLRQALGANVIAKPLIDLYNSFNNLAVAAGLGVGFNPFGDEISFLVGAYIFEDVGVTAYAGAAASLTQPANLTYAANILAAEGYHTGAIRGFLSEIGAGATTNAISNVRNALSQQIVAGPVDDYGTDAQGNAYNFASTDVNALAFLRTPQQVLNIVYGGATATGGFFFPNGVNGAITNSGLT